MLTSRNRLYLAIFDWSRSGSCRHRSTTSAIKSGLRATEGASDRAGRWKSRDNSRSFEKPRQSFNGERDRDNKKSFDRPRPKTGNAFGRDRDNKKTFDRPRPEIDDAFSRHRDDRKSFDRPRSKTDNAFNRGHDDKKSFDRPRPKVDNAFSRDRDMKRTFDRPRPKIDDAFSRDRDNKKPFDRSRPKTDDAFSRNGRPSDSRPLRNDREQRPRDGQRTEGFRRADGPPRWKSPEGDSSPPMRRPQRGGDRDFASKGKEDDRVPETIPYSTAASVFLYGINSILAALRGKRRKAYRLYLAPRAPNHPIVREIVKLATAAGVQIQNDTSPRLLDKMTAIGTEGGEARPHNGAVLETSKLPSLPVLGLGEPDAITKTLQLDTDHQSVEEAAINSATGIPRFPSTRQPFVVLLDGITDPGNLGNILRTAHFYNVDAVAVATNTCAPLSSAVLAKASAGACEAIPIFALPKPANFVYTSARAGWQICAAAPAPAENSKSEKEPTPHLTTTSLLAQNPLLSSPSILMLGAEGEGLRANLTAKASYLLSIEQGTRSPGAVDVGVESLNVGVAAGVLIEAFMRGAEDAAGPPSATSDVVETPGDLGF